MLKSEWIWLYNTVSEISGYMFNKLNKNLYTCATKPVRAAKIQKLQPLWVMLAWLVILLVMLKGQNNAISLWHVLNLACWKVEVEWDILFNLKYLSCIVQLSTLPVLNEFQTKHDSTWSACNDAWGSSLHAINLFGSMIMKQLCHC